MKAAIPRLAELPERDAAVELRRVLERVRRYSLVRGLRGVEQTPETAFVAVAALQAYPPARGVHLVRDGRDVVCSLLEKGWLSAERGGGDDAGLPYGARARFWVEPERRAEFEAASDATRAAWAWRAYVTAARTARGARAGAALRVARRRARDGVGGAGRRISASTRPSSPAASTAPTTARSAASAATSRPSSSRMSSARPARCCTSSATTSLTAFSQELLRGCLELDY